MATIIRRHATVVSAQWLRANLESVRILDCSWHMPATGRNGKNEFNLKRIPRAQFFDIDTVSAPSDLPHMMPSASLLSNAMRELGINSGEHVIVYDGAGIFSSPRVWYTLRMFGGVQVSILDGGFPAWERESLPIETSSPTKPPQGNYDVDKPDDSARRRIITLEEVQQFLESGGTLLDARSTGRFSGTDPEPREGLSSGHIKGSVSVPFASLFDTKGCFKSPKKLGDLLDPFMHGSDVGVTCGSGVTACIIAAAIQHAADHGCLSGEASQKLPRLYDGAWTEWASSGQSIEKL